MSYSLVADLTYMMSESRVEELVKDSTSESISLTTTTNAGYLRWKACRDKADAEIDVYLSGRFSTPLTSVPEIIKQYSVTLTKYFLYTRRNNDIPESLLREVEKVYTDLEKIREGTIDIGIETSGDDDSFFFLTNKDSTNKDFKDNGESILTRGTIGGLRINTDKTKDEDAEVANMSDITSLYIRVQIKPNGDCTTLESYYAGNLTYALSGDRLTITSDRNIFDPEVGSDSKKVNVCEYRNSTTFDVWLVPNWENDYEYVVIEIFKR
jgi:phage gp36-like protein